MNRIVIAVMLVALLAPAAVARNMVANGDFSDGEPYPDHWHVRLTDFMPEVARHDDGSRTHQYICACGHNLGEWKPWVGLLCPKCQGFISGEECGSWYVRNHERVSLDNGASGKCLKFTLPTNVGNNQGVRVFSRLIKCRKGWGYILSFDARAAGAKPRVFVECYRETKREGSFTWDPEFNPHDLVRPLERCYRAHVNCSSPTNRTPDRGRRASRDAAPEEHVARSDDTSDSSYETFTVRPGGWGRYTKEVVAPRRYHFEWMCVKLYAYLPGVAWFDNVRIVPMTPSQLRAYIRAKNQRIKDKRFLY